MLEERIFELSRIVKWHKRQMKENKKLRNVWKCVLACTEQGAILLEIGDLIKQVESDPKFKIRIRGEICCLATAQFEYTNDSGMIDGRATRKTDWDFDLTASTTIFRLDEDYKYETLKYPLYIPDLELDLVDEICDAEAENVEGGEQTEDAVSITFCLPCVLVQVDSEQVEHDLKSTHSQKNTIMTSMKTVFKTNLEKIQTF